MPRDAETLRLAGYGISPGVGMGTAYVYHDVVQRVESVYRLRCDREVDAECRRLEQAIGTVLADLERGEEDVRHSLDAQFARIFRAHRAMLEDGSLRGAMREMIHKTRMNAECVVSGVFRRLEDQFRQVHDSHMAERGDDVRDLARRLLRTLAGAAAHDGAALPANTVVVATGLLPSDTVHFSRHLVSAVVVEQGGPASHTAILTRELGIPAVSGVENATERIPAGQRTLVDANDGIVVVGPDEAAEQAFRDRRARWTVGDGPARKRADGPARTRDGEPVSVRANISCGEDARLALECGADGVGLYRIENLYFGREKLPTEDTLIACVRETLEPFNPDTPVTLRLLDTGGDKPLPFLDHPVDCHPLLGLRGVRFLLAYPDLLRTQLRAFLRLAEDRAVRILVPMVTLTSDMRAVRALYEEVAGELRCDRPPPLGSMIETPAAAICAETLVEVSDFLSIGTNDLTQYTLAAARETTDAIGYFLEDHPAIFRLIAHTVRAAGDTPCAVCGELAGRREAVAALLHRGVRELSVNPLQVASIKEAVGRVALDTEDMTAKR